MKEANSEIHIQGCLSEPVNPVASIMKVSCSKSNENNGNQTRN